MPGYKRHNHATQQRKIDLLASGAQIDVKLVPGGFTASIDYTQYELGFDVTVLLYDDGSIEATIPESSIYENSDTNKIGNIYLFPMLGNTKLAPSAPLVITPRYAILLPSCTIPYTGAMTMTVRPTRRGRGS